MKIVRSPDSRVSLANEDMAPPAGAGTYFFIRSPQLALWANVRPPTSRAVDIQCAQHLGQPEIQVQANQLCRIWLVLMPEVTHARKYHGQSQAVRCVNYFLIPH